MSSTSVFAPSGAGAAPDGEQPGANGNRWKILALGALGVVYGDIGTSPLYALRECFHGPPEHRMEPTELNVFGVTSAGCMPRTNARSSVT